MSPKAALVVLVVVLALFAGAVALGASRDDGTSEDDSSLLDRLGEVAGDPSAVARDDIAAGCVDDDDPDLLVFPGGLVGGCTLVVQNGGELRLVRLLALDAIGVSAPAPEGDLDVDDGVAAGEEVRVAVGEGETEIDLSCGFAGECRVRLVAG